jgi:hypothetical protein
VLPGRSRNPILAGASLPASSTRRRSALLWAAATRRPRPHQPPCELPRPLLMLTDPQSPSNYGRNPTAEGRHTAAASGSLWSTPLRPSSTPFDHAPSFLTPPGSSLTTASSPPTTGPLPPLLTSTAGRRSLSCRRYKLPPHEFQVSPGAQGFTGASPFFSPRRRRSPTTGHAGQASRPPL